MGAPITAQMIGKGEKRPASPIDALLLHRGDRGLDESADKAFTLGAGEKAS